MDGLMIEDRHQSVSDSTDTISRSTSQPKVFFSSSPLNADRLLVRDLSIVVVDDNLYARRLVASVLVSIGVKRLRLFADGRTALEGISRESPNVLICDLMMKPMDGLGLLRAIRRGGRFADVPDAIDIDTDLPVIMMTSLAGQNLVTQSIELGANGYIIKPIRPRFLIERIARVMRRRMQRYVV